MTGSSKDHPQICQVNQFVSRITNVKPWDFIDRIKPLFNDEMSEILFKMAISREILDVVIETAS